MLYRPRSRWTWLYFLSILCKGLIALALELYIFAVLQLDVRSDVNAQSATRIFPTFTVLLALAFVYQLLLLYDTLGNENTIQVFSLCFYDWFLFIYAVLQIKEFKAAELDLSSEGDVELTVWIQTKPAASAIAVLTCLFAFCTCLISWKLYSEFAWSLFKYVQADFALRRRYLIFQCYIALLKLNLFLSVGFLVQLLLVVNKENAEWIITLCVIPASVLSLMAGSLVTRREKYYSSIMVMIFNLALLGFYAFKVSRIYSSSYEHLYSAARMILTYFASITIILSITTIGTQGMCIINYGKGLKPYIAGDWRAQELTDQYEEGHQVDEDGTYGFQMTSIENATPASHRMISSAS